VDTDKLQAALAGKVDGEVRFDAGTRGAYAHDGSNYRQPPLGVVVPKSPEAAQAAVAVCVGCQRSSFTSPGPWSAANPPWSPC
jgi:FAD/FMN-containing dehydrogenase